MAAVKSVPAGLAHLGADLWQSSPNAMALRMATGGQAIKTAPAGSSLGGDACTIEGNTIGSGNGAAVYANGVSNLLISGNRISVESGSPRKIFIL